ncbi:MAG: hypothetical protein K0Q99_1991 [Clostridia bacterium]|jgi:hypothetical protein|nr:hypothetical protein [Clostridia bacterium]
MKPLLLAMFFLIIIIAGSLLTMTYIGNEAESLLINLNELERLIDADDWPSAQSSFQGFKTKWAEVDHKWSMLIDHTEIDYITMDLGELEAYIKAKDKTHALAKLSSLLLLVEHIPDKEYPSLKNIL